MFIPSDDRVLVKRDKAEETSKGGLYLPDDSKEKPLEGVVVSVGPGKRSAVSTVGHRHAPPYKTGDRVLFGRYAGTEIKIDGEEYLILHEDEILGRRVDD